MTDTYIWAKLENGTKRNMGYIEKKEGVKLGARVEMIDLDGEFWTITELSDEKSRAYVMGRKNRGKDFAHSIA